LTDSPPWLHCKFLYDERGSELFEKICQQPEYYPTRTEESILARHAADIARETGSVNLIELGSGSSVKTDHLLRAYSAESDSVLYVPVDVSESAIVGARDAIVKSHEAVTVTGIVGTYEKAFPLFGEMSPSMVVFLGSTIGNFNQHEADRFLHEISHALSPGDYFLLGVDLVKDERVLNAAYNDAAGVTAEFTKNLFVRINRELGASVDLEQIDHVAEFNADWQRIETFLRFRSDQEVYIKPLDRTIPIPAETMVMTEISRKFTLDQIRDNLPMYGFEVKRVFTDDHEWFGVLLLEKTGAAE
jgi:L-histidine N-alpha-methyltransferase